MDTKYLSHFTIEEHDAIVALFGAETVEAIDWDNEVEYWDSVSDFIADTLGTEDADYLPYNRQVDFAQAAGVTVLDVGDRKAFRITPGDVSTEDTFITFVERLLLERFADAAPEQRIQDHELEGYTHAVAEYILTHFDAGTPRTVIADKLKFFVSYNDFITYLHADTLLDFYEAEDETPEDIAERMEACVFDNNLLADLTHSKIVVRIDAPEKIDAPETGDDRN